MRRSTCGDVAAGRMTANLAGHTGRINSVVFSPDGATLASGASDRTVRLWDVAAGTEIATLEGARSELDQRCRLLPGREEDRFGPWWHGQGLGLGDAGEYRHLRYGPHLQNRNHGFRPGWGGPGNRGPGWVERDLRGPSMACSALWDPTTGTALVREKLPERICRRVLYPLRNRSRSWTAMGIPIFRPRYGRPLREPLWPPCPTSTRIMRSSPRPSPPMDSLFSRDTSTGSWCGTLRRPL